MATLSLGNVKTDSLNSGSGTIQTTGAIIGNSVSGASVLASTLNATTSTTGSTTCSSLNLTGNWVWPSLNAVNQITQVNNATAVPASLLTAANTIVGGGSVTAAPQTFSFSVASAGVYEISIGFMYAISANNQVMTLTVTFDGAAYLTFATDRVSLVNTGFNTFFHRRLRTLTAGAHTLLPNYVGSGGSNVQIKDVYIKCKRVST